MAYVQMADKVREELLENLEGRVEITYPTTVSLRIASAQLIEAEKQLVAAYGLWREAMGDAHVIGSEKATEYLRRTTWDLT